MERKSTLITTIALLLALLLAACGGETAEPTPTPAPEPTADNTAETTETIETEEDTAETTGGLQTYTVITEQSSASYIVDEEFLSEALEKLGIEAGKQVIVGTTPGVNGDIQLNFDNPDPLVSAQFTVDMTSLETNQNRRDNWLSDNAIQTSTYPEATFVATGASGLPDSPPADGEEITFQLSGDLTVRETTIPATFDVTATLSGGTITGNAVTNLNLTDLGITPPDFANTLTVADPFAIEITLTAQR